MAGRPRRAEIQSFANRFSRLPNLRRSTFLRGLAALAAAGTLPLSTRAATNLKMMIPANPGGRLGHRRPGHRQVAEGGGRRLGQLRQQGRRRRRHRPGPVRQRLQGRPECAHDDGRRDAGRHHHRQAASLALAGHAAGAPDQRIQRLRVAGRLAAEVHEGRGRATQERPGQREVGRRLARLDRAHRRGDAGAPRSAPIRRRSTTSPFGAAAR